jgi:hypothetical protein
MIQHPSELTCRHEAQSARSRALRCVALLQQSSATSDLAVARRRHLWLRALRAQAEAILWERAAREAQRMRETA